MAIRKPIIALVQAEFSKQFHALLVDRVTAGEVAVRDPLPPGQGTAYRLALSAFLARWLDRETGCGAVVAVLQ